MTNKEMNLRFPIISFRITAVQREYLRLKAKKKKMEIKDYIRAVLFPLGFPSEK